MNVISVKSNQIKIDEGFTLEKKNFMSSVWTRQQIYTEWSCLHPVRHWSFNWLEIYVARLVGVVVDDQWK